MSNIFVVMSCGINNDGSISDELKERCDCALSRVTENDVCITSSSFTLNKKPVISNKIISEASIAHNYLKQKISCKNLYCEQQSHDTIGSIFFLFQNYFPLFKAQKIIFITSWFHADRVKIIANHLNIIFKRNYKIELVRTKKLKISSARIKHEKKQIDYYKDYYFKLKNKKHYFLYLLQNHDNYNHLFSSKKLFNLKDGY